MLEDEMLTIEDLAAYLKLKPQTIYKWAQTGKIPGAKFGKEWRFRRSTIEQWIDDNFPPRSKTPSPKVEGPAEALESERLESEALESEDGPGEGTREPRSTALAEGGNSASRGALVSPTDAVEAPAPRRKKSVAKGASPRKKAHGPGGN